MASTRTAATSRTLRRICLAAAGASGVIFAWQATILYWRIPGYLMPSPASVLHAVFTNWQVLASQSSYTLGAAAIGLTISTAFAVVLALLFSMSRTLEQASMPAVIAFRSAPVAAVAPIIMLFFGRGIATSIAVVTIVSFFPRLVNVSRGLNSADRNAVELMHVYGASRWQQLRLVRIPFALPYLFTGLRIAATSSILGAMLSEWITGSRGLGFLILESGEMREIELLWAAVLTSIVVSLTVFWLTSAGERRALRWKI